MSQKRKINLRKVNLVPKAKPITAAGGVVYKISEDNSEPAVLLIHRRNFWDLPKGKLDPGESIPMCAVREVAEETGSELPVIVEALQTSYHEYKDRDSILGKTTWWYSMVYPRVQIFRPEAGEGIEEVRWVPLSEAREMVGYENLRNVLTDFEKSLK